MNKLSVICGLLTLVQPSNAVHAAEFYGLGSLPGGSFVSFAYGISGDGKVVVGPSNNAVDGGPNREEGFRWSETTGMAGLGVGTGEGSVAYATDYTGNLVVGRVGGEGTIWRVDEDGVEILHKFSPDAAASLRGLSHDGTVAVGYGWLNAVPPNSDYAVAVKWTPGEGLTQLEGGVPHSIAYGVSADGQTIVGSIQDVGYQAFRWTQAEGMVGLGHLPGGSGISDAYGTSADGSVIVGESTSALAQEGNFREAFRWTSETGMVGLGSLPGGYFSSKALAVSADGTKIVGQSYTESGDERPYRPEAFLWTEADGMMAISELLADAGVDLTGWNLDSATGISANGYVITGYGINPNGDVEAWLADFSFLIPEPSALALALLTVMGVLTSRVPLPQAAKLDVPVSHTR